MNRLSPFLLLLCVAACQKKNAGTAQSNPLISQAHSYFTGILSRNLPTNSTNYRSNQMRVPAWDQAKVQHLSIGTAVIIPVTFQNKLYVATNLARSYLLDLSRITQLVIFQDVSGQFHYQVLTLIPDSNTILHPGNFTGIALTEDWSGNSLIGPQRIDQSLSTPETSQRPVAADEFAITTCDDISGYNYAAGDAANGETWEETTCTTYDIGGGGSDASYSNVSSGDYSDVGGGGGGGGAVSIQIAPPNNIISSLPTYFSCFTNVGGSDHSFTVTVCADEPEPGTRTPWSLQDASDATANSNPINTGHTFLILTESYGTTVTTRNIGFYPATKVYPYSQSTETAGGVYNNDQAHEYNISGTMNLTNAQFFQILNYCQDNPAMSYNLNTNNCTTFVLNAVAQAGINLPRTIGTWPGGSGVDPGDLGEDMRAGNIPGMTVNTSPTSNHMNVGICYP
jgi:hypothetical protein